MAQRRHQLNISTPNISSFKLFLCKFKLFRTIISRETINIYYKHQMQINISKLDDQLRKLQEKIEIRKHTIKNIRDDLRKKLQSNVENASGVVVVREKSYINTQTLMLKQQINSLNMYYATMLNIFRMKLQLEDTTIYTEVHEGLRQCVKEMSNYISPDTLKRIEETTSMIEENTEKISDIERSIQDISTIVTNQATSSFELNQVKSENEDEELMNELNMLLNDDDDKLTLQKQQTKVSTIQSPTFKTGKRIIVTNNEANTTDEFYDIPNNTLTASKKSKKEEKVKLMVND